MGLYILIYVCGIAHITYGLNFFKPQTRNRVCKQRLTRPGRPNLNACFMRHKQGGEMTEKWNLLLAVEEPREIIPTWIVPV